MKKSAKPLYFPWNEEVFLSDVHVRGMNSIQRWMYRTLLQSAFFTSTRPFLPNEDSLLWVLAGAENRNQWEENKVEVLKMFRSRKLGSANVLENNGVMKSWRKLLEERERMVTLGKRSAEVRRTFNARSTETQQEKLREVEVKEREDKKENLSASLSENGETEMQQFAENKSAKRVREKLVPSWQTIKKSTRLTLPAPFGNWAKEWNDIAATVPFESLKSAFEQWAVEEGDGTADYPMHKFIGAWKRLRVEGAEGLSPLVVDPEEEARRLASIEAGRARDREINQIPVEEEEPKLAPGESF